MSPEAGRRAPAPKPSAQKSPARKPVQAAKPAADPPRNAAPGSGHTGERILQGSLTFLGFAIAVIAVIYFAGAYIPDVGEWTQLSALLLMGVFFATLGVYVRSTDIGGPFFGDRLLWLRPTYVLYLLSIISGIVAEIRFLTIDEVARPIKILVSLLIGVGLIVLVARGERRRARR